MSGEEVRGLAAKWRLEAGEEVADDDLDPYWLGRRHCAIEVEQALSNRPAPSGKLVAWWNGIGEDITERSPYGPSIRWGADAEDSRHDIPLYDGYNPIHYAPRLIPPPKPLEEMEGGDAMIAKGHNAFAKGWNACRDAMLRDAPAPSEQVAANGGDE